MAGYFSPSNLLVSEPLQCLRGGREPSQALHLSSSLCLWCEAVAGEHVCVRVCVCVPELMALPAHSRCSLHIQPHKLVAAPFSKHRAAGVLSCDSVSVAAGTSGLFESVAEGWCCAQEEFDFFCQPAPAWSSLGPSKFMQPTLSLV